MGRNVSLRPSLLLQIEDEVIAFDFDLTCTTRLLYYDMELEKNRLDAMSGGAISQAMGGSSNHQVVGEITQADFRDQGL